MASINRADVAATIEALRLMGSDEFQLDLDVEVQTDKDRVKLVPCRDCQRPLVVTTFFAPAKAVCKLCVGDDSTARIATVGVPIPGQTDPAKAVHLTDCLINVQFAFAVCPVHPDDEEHVMELKAVNHSDTYGPGEWVAKSGRREWRQTAKGETVMHQCEKCNAVVTYSTRHVVQYKRQNEPRDQPDTGLPHRNSLLGVRDPSPAAA